VKYIIDFRRLKALFSPLSAQKSASAFLRMRFSAISGNFV